MSIRTIRGIAGLSLLICCASGCSETAAPSISASASVLISSESPTTQATPSPRTTAVIPSFTPAPSEVPNNVFAEPWAYWEEDLGKANIDSSLRFYDENRAEPESELPERAYAQDAAAALMDEFVSRIHNSITEKAELSLEDLYDTRNDIRRGDLLLNQMYIYSKITAMASVIESKYAGGRHKFIWSDFDFENNTGLIIGYLSPIIETRYNSSVESGTVTNGSADNPHFPHEFAILAENETCKVIRHRYYDFDFSAIQKLMVENPDRLANPDDFRKLLDEHLE